MLCFAAMNEISLPPGDTPLPFPDFPLLRVRLRVGSLGLALPDYAGGVWRGGFGMALKQLAPAAFDCLFGGALTDDPERDKLFAPYMLVPPPGGSLPAGQTCETELRLFGAATAHYAACREALARLGELGVGAARGRFVLLAAAPLRPGEPPRWDDAASPVAALPASAWCAATPEERMSRMRLSLQTPLRLKAGGRLIETAPEFAVFWARLVTRIHLAAGRAVLSAEARAALDEHAHAVALEHAAVRWMDWTRYSARQKQAMPFGGLLGDLRYRGDLTPFAPWLRLGEALGVGGKTSFGLGAYRLDAA